MWGYNDKQQIGLDFYLDLGLVLENALKFIF